ncbi:TPA: CDP-glycerol glycerophosphotransferase family protein [Providencia rettgeri]
MNLKGNVKYLYDFYSLKGKKCIPINNDYIVNLTFFKYTQFCISVGCSKSIFLSHGIGLLPISCFLTKRIQLWHGYPIKKILLNSKFDTIKYQSKILNFLYLTFYKIRIKISYSYLITSNSILGNELSDSFRYKKNKVIYYGSPSQEVAENNKRKRDDIHYKVLYLPTWRDGKDNIVKIIQSISDTLDYNFLKENNIIIDIKLHPYEMDRININNRENNRINFITNDPENMIELYSCYNCLITDYSSACFEFAPLGGNVIFFAPDLFEYTKERGLTLEYKELANNKIAYSLPELKEAIFESRYKTNSYTLNYKKYVGTSNRCMELIYEKF